MTDHDEKPENPFGYEILRRLSFSSYTYLSRERASERLIILKYFQTNRRASFEKEAKVLAHLANFDGVPNLYFATENESESGAFRFCIGMEFVAGKSLLELVQDKSADCNWKKISENLTSGLKRLHEHYGVVHGDLSPVNIIVRGSDQRVMFVDWEFSEKISEQNLASYESYRGTPGFNPLDAYAGLAKKDQEALQACLKYCGVLEPRLTEIQINTSFFQKLFKGK